MALACNPSTWKVGGESPRSPLSLSGLQKILSQTCKDGVKTVVIVNKQSLLSLAGLQRDHQTLSPSQRACTLSTTLTLSTTQNKQLLRLQSIQAPIPLGRPQNVSGHWKTVETFTQMDTYGMSWPSPLLSPDPGDRNRFRQKPVCTQL